ncbi:hypothetical protein ABT263_35525 [Kitasatospora sp. NPDC001603]|uniref:hypothetical protein n=1 Tax=Kitasatospora sp. NPDC001603 TaxID=3154388 RepID=UPI0033254D9F
MRLAICPRSGASLVVADEAHYLQFAVTVGQSDEPLEHLREMESAVSKSLKEYKQHRMAGAAVNGHEAAVWEFSYAAKEGGRRRAVEAESIDDDGTDFSHLPARTRTGRRAERRFTTVLNHFTPTH